jgi:prepilin-type N-terminal cleavage/methylation domain-containing protein/prepilin-type processing-associated H-X9-DG protein
MNSQPHTAQAEQKTPAGFTLTELLVVMVVLAILALMVLPVFARTQPNLKAAQCRHNLKQLITAWQMYPEDYSGTIVPNFGGSYVPTVNGPAGWATGWLDWSTSQDNTNVLFLIEQRYAALAPYVQGATNLFKCPADDYVSPLQQARGWTRRVRSYSVNAYVGENVPPGQSPSGPNNYVMYKQIRKVSEFFYPTPAGVALFIDEHPDSMNDPMFWSPNLANNWPDFPATYHDGAAAFAFADGHTEEHKWKGSLTAGRATRVSYLNLNNYPAPAGDPDLSWMSYHTPRVSNQSY